MSRCKERVFSGSPWHSRQCSRNEWKDGYCKQHHPDTVRARQEESDRRHNEKLEQSPWVRLEKAHAKIAELEGRIKELESVR